MIKKEKMLRSSKKLKLLSMIFHFSKTRRKFLSNTINISRSKRQAHVSSCRSRSVLHREL